MIEFFTRYGLLGVPFHVSYAAGYPEVLEQAVPNYWMISEYASPVLLDVFLVALLETLVETGAGLAQGMIERIEAAIRPVNQLKNPRIDPRYSCT